MARRRNINNKRKEKSTNSPAINKSEVPEKSKEVPEDKTVEGTKDIPSAKNDPDWYARDPRLLVDGASIPFSLPFGAKLDYFPNRPNVAIPGGRSLGTDVEMYPNPGICSIVLKPSMGANGDKSSPANVCANALYTHVRYINSGRKNYDPADLFMYVSAFGDIYSYLIWCIRLYQYAFMYSQRNWYIGKDMLYANGVNAQNILRNLANFRYWINSAINKVSSFCLPGDIYYFKRRVFLYSNYYIENPYGNMKDQLYQFVPEGFYAFGFDSNGAGKLFYEKLPNVQLTLEHIQTFFEVTLMGNITGDEDFGLMSGDILKAYGSNIITLSQIGEEGGLLPVHDPYVLSQMKNCFASKNIIRGDVTKTYVDHNNTAHVFGDIEQSTDGLIMSLETTDWDSDAGSSVWGAGEHVISVESPDPTPGDVIEATRLMPHLGLFPNYANPGSYFYCFNCGTEIAVGIKITKEPGADVDLVDSWWTAQNDAQTGTYGLAVYKGVYISSFKYAPIAYALHVENNQVTFFRCMSNLDNTTMISNDILKRIHEIALLSLFYVPGVAKLV